MSSITKPRFAIHPVWAIGLFVLIAVAGLIYVKWYPYVGKAMLAADTHSIGGSILAGPDGAIPEASWQAALNYAVTYGLSIWKALILGLLLGSAVQALLPGRWIRRWLGKRNSSSVLAASLLAVPSMMCTCCSAPVVRGLRQCRAAPGSAAAYWLGNPMLNPATLVFMGFVLGWHWAGLRLALGLVMVVGLGLLLNWLARRRTDGVEVSIPAESAPELAMNTTAILRRWASAFFHLSWRLLPEYLIIVLLLGAARAWLFPSMDVGVDNSLFWIIGLAIAGMLFVIPTAGEVPIVQAMLVLGMATGPAAALLVVLPAISLPSLAMVAKGFSKKELAILMLGVVVIGIAGAGAAIGLGF